MGAFKGGGNLFNLTTGLLRAEVDRCPNRYCANIERLLHAGVEGLVILGWVAERLVVVQFDEERNAVGITP